MKKFLLVCIFLLLNPSCKKSDPTPTSSDELSVTGMDIAVKLREWSVSQPKPFVINWIGDTTGGSLFDNGDFITNINSKNPDSLIFNIYNGYIRFEYTHNKNQLKILYDSISSTLSEEQILPLLKDLGLQLRMMEYDSLTYNLNLKLLKWASHQYPPKIIWSDFHTFVYQGPNSGGYSRPIYLPHGVQNLQYFTRKISQANLNTIVSLVDTSLTFDQLHDILMPIAQIQIHNTILGFD